MRGWIDPPSVRTAVWALRASVVVRRQLSRGVSPLDVRVPSAPTGERRAVRGLNAVLRHRQSLCLEQSLLTQSWLCRHGESVDVVIGVTHPRDFSAHAWLDGREPHAEETYGEVLRRPASTVNS